MKAFIVNKYEKKGKLQLANVPEPTLGDNEALVEIHATGVNVLDPKIRDGEFKLILPYKTPFTLGHDMAGVIIKIGASVSKFKVGDEVFARPRDYHIGTFAERIAVNEDDMALKPKNLSMEEAASIPLVGLTAWQVLVEKANLKKGQKVFIQAGSGGVGTFAIQLAKHLGAYVATTTSADNFELVKRLGADVVIDYKKDDFEKTLKDYDVVLNSQNEETLQKSLRILKSRGSAISITGPADVDFAKAIKANLLVQSVIYFMSRKIRNLAKKLGVNYSFLFMRAQGEQLSQIAKLIEDDVIKPVMDKVFTFEQTNEALEYIEAGRSKGKVVIRVKQ
jgi:NADPH:quinone reductase-like Zn-dependent oxidoreductase